jgi:hypothetical protein
MAVTEQHAKANAPSLTIDWREIRQHWPVYGAYVVFCAGLLLAAFARSIGGLKPDELLLGLLAGALIVRRVVRRDFSFSVTWLDAGFAAFILAGTVLPLIALLVRGSYLTSDDLQGVVGPVEYYVWYRVFLEAVPLPQRLPEFTRLMLVVVTIISAIGILQVTPHLSIVQHELAKYFPTTETLEFPLVHRATSLVGGWEVLAALAAYAIIFINQMQTKEENLLALGKHWDRWLLVMLGINVVALIATQSTGGLIALAVGYLVAWRLNGRLARTTIIVFVVGIAAAIVLSPLLAHRVLAEFSTHHSSGGLLSKIIPQTWSERGLHWEIVASAVSVNVPTAIFGVSPGFLYPVLDFGSTESLYFLLLYRGGLIYVAAFVFFVVMLLRTINRARLRSSSFNRQFLTVVLTIIAMNLAIDIIDAHLVDAGEKQLLFTLVAVSLGVAQRTDRQASDDAASEQTGLRQALPLALPHLKSRAIVASALAVVVAAAALGGAVMLRNQTLQAPVPPMTLAIVDPGSPITTENTHLGASTWVLDPGVDTTDLVGYAGTTSALPGDTVQLYISARVPTVFNIDVYRMGWYYGLGSRLYFTAHHLTAPAQGTWTPNGGLSGCPTCKTDQATHLLDARWRPTYGLHIPSGWPTGVYLIKLSSLNASPREESYIPLVVRQPESAKSQSQILVVLPVNTYQAENAWGGYSMLGPATTPSPGDSNLDRARQVSFNRPYSQDAGAGELLENDLHTIRFLERAGYDVSYATDVDLATDPTLTIGHKAILLPGYSAYWTSMMRNELQAARDVGINLAFFGGGDGYWQARLAPDAAGDANRTLICYKVATGAKSPADRLSADPIYASDPSLVTAAWRDPAINRPENVLLGLMYGFTAWSSPTYLPGWIASTVPVPSIEASALIGSDQSVTGSLLGDQLDTIAPNGQTPPGLTILGESPVLDDSLQLQTAYAAYYRTPDGTYVFDAGTNWWSDALDQAQSPWPGAVHVDRVQGSRPIIALTELLLRAMTS